MHTYKAGDNVVVVDQYSGCRKQGTVDRVTPSGKQVHVTLPNHCRATVFHYQPSQAQHFTTFGGYLFPQAD